jgi:ribulose-phosphate 3-epimerase
MIDERDLACELEVDGGINNETAKMCINAGANVIVVGSDLFAATDRVAQIKSLRS